MPLSFPDIKRVCIYGVGGVGGYYGGRIAEALQKDGSLKGEIYFIARGEHLKALQQNGITVKTPERIIRGMPNSATDSIRKIPAPDLILVCVKSYDLQAAAADIRANIKATTIILPLLNGIDIYERIRSLLEAGTVLPSCVYLGTHIESPGVINQSGGNGIILTGPDPRFPQYSVRNLLDFFKKAGIGIEWKDSAYPAIWEKFIFIAAFGLVTACARKSLGEVMAEPELSNQVRGIIQEIVAISGKKRIQLPGDIVEKSLQKAYNFPFNAKTSFQRDVESWPKPNEGDLYGGAIIKAGAAYGVPVPITERVYSRILQSLERPL
jgi:2-dehydropantoate 2-reductase